MFIGFWYAKIFKCYWAFQIVHLVMTCHPLVFIVHNCNGKLFWVLADGKAEQADLLCGDGL